ncbi:hypothetical protein ACM64Y_08210 [Novispirillum sp. DQ9]|uniref:hypothetical protein n=1 Tax=Novispirillum sp. DQ9 TaxID=3398612 RepID=UPI003C7E1631
MMGMAKALLVGATMLWATSAVAGDQDFRLTNKTGYQINEIYVSSAKTDDWEEDVMGRDALPNGDYVDIEFSKGERSCKWDLKAVYDDGEEAIWYDFNLCEIRKITLRYNDKTGETTAIYE